MLQHLYVFQQNWIGVHLKWAKQDIVSYNQACLAKKKSGSSAQYESNMHNWRQQKATAIGSSSS